MRSLLPSACRRWCTASKHLRSGSPPLRAPSRLRGLLSESANRPPADASDPARMQMGSEPEPGDAPGPPTEHLASDGGATLESALVVGVGVCAAAFGGSYVATHGLGETVAAARETVDAFSLQIASMGPSGYVLFALCYGFCEVLLLPATPLALSAGALFGVAGGTALSSCGALVGAITSFFLGRTVLRSTVLRFVGTAPWFGALERVAKRDGFKAVLLLNLSPLAGIQNVLNYAYGTTSVGVGPYAAASWLACLPRTWATVSAGSLASSSLASATGESGSSGVESEHHWGLVIGIAAAVGATLLVGKEAKGALQEMEAEAEAAAAVVRGGGAGAGGGSGVESERERTRAGEE